jgi:secretion/DNA translocation related TadE-like protein
MTALTDRGIDRHRASDCDRDGEERGSVSVVIAGVLAASIVLGLGAADVTAVLSVASEAQTAADAAALAAAQELAVPTETLPEDVARAFAEANGGMLVSCTCARDTRDAEIEVSLPVGPLLLFGDDRFVVARAHAVVDVPGATS